jgi:oxygen-independent coproporphyrinogen-3 oxidase
VRWWNVKHPTAYTDAVRRGWPAQAREVLTGDERRTEEVMLRLRLDSGLPLDRLEAAGVEVARRAATDGLLDASALASGRAVLTLRGRLLADALVRDLLAAG